MDNKETKTLEMEEISVIEKYDLEKCVEWINSKEIDTVSSTSLFKFNVFSNFSFNQ